jgi:hypothetical protein
VFISLFIPCKFRIRHQSQRSYHCLASGKPQSEKKPSSWPNAAGKLHKSLLQVVPAHASPHCADSQFSSFSTEDFWHFWPGFTMFYSWHAQCFRVSCMRKSPLTSTAGLARCGVQTRTDGSIKELQASVLIVLWMSAFGSKDPIWSLKIIWECKASLQEHILRLAGAAVQSLFWSVTTS